MLEDYVEATKGPNGEPGVVIVHVEACDHLHRVLNKIRELGGSPSVALNPHTPAEAVKNVLCDVDHVLAAFPLHFASLSCKVRPSLCTWTCTERAPARTGARALADDSPVFRRAAMTVMR